MKISTRGRYALRLMLDLALADPEEYCSVKSIAARQQISEKYMEQIISQLVKAGFVRSVRGAPRRFTDWPMPPRNTQRGRSCG